MPTFGAALAGFIAATHTSGSKSTGLNWWQIIVVISVVLGILVGLGSFVDWGGRIRNRRVNKTVDELVRSKLEADDIEGRLAGLSQLNDSLREQISRVSDEANRLFLQSRMEQLATGIARDFDEYISIQGKINTSESSATLDPRIRNAIEGTILPPQRRRDRRIAYALVLLAVILALNLSPLSPNFFVYRYFSVLSNSPAWTADSPIWAITIGSLVIALVLLFVSDLLTRLWKMLDVFNHRTWIVGLGILLGVSIALGYWMRDLVVSEQCSPYPCSFPTTGGWLMGAGIAFNAAPIIGGVLLVVLIRWSWRRRVRSREVVS